MTALRLGPLTIYGELLNTDEHGDPRIAPDLAIRIRRPGRYTAVGILRIVDDSTRDLDIVNTRRTTRYHRLAGRWHAYTHRIDYRPPIR